MTAKGAWVLAARQQEAFKRLKEFLSRALDTEDDAVLERVARAYVAHKLVKLDPHSGQFNAKHGALLDAEVVRTFERNTREVG